MRLHELPAEILSLIAEALEREADVNALVQVSRIPFEILNAALYRRNIARSNSALRWGVARNSIDTVRKCLELGAPFDSEKEGDSDNPSWNELSPICLATKQNHLEILVLLLEHGANPDCGYKGCISVPIILTSHHSDRAARSAIFRTLLKFGASLSPVFQLALLTGNADLAKDVLRMGATLEQQLAPGIGTLGMAINSGGLELVQFLFDELHQDPMSCWMGGVSALSVAAEAGHDHLVRFFLRRGLDVNAVDENRYTALHHAAIRGHAVVEVTLLDAGAAPDMRDIHGRTPLAWAAARGHLSVLDVLLSIDSSAVNRDSVGNDSYTPLILASVCNYPTLVQALLDHGAARDLTVVGTDRDALSYTAQEGHIDVIKVLLDSGADVSRGDLAGFTPLCYAAAEGHLAVVELLWDNGARMEMQDPNASSPLTLASNAGHDDIVAFLLDAAMRDVD